MLNRSPSLSPLLELFIKLEGDYDCLQIDNLEIRLFKFKILPLRPKIILAILELNQSLKDRLDLVWIMPT